MPFIANTPESFLGRSDSKNPATTCRGITSSGRPCRRALKEIAPPSQQLLVGLAEDPTDATLYCWQHKEQASRSARSSPDPRRDHVPILEVGEVGENNMRRSSLDTLADRLGLDVNLRKNTVKGGWKKGRKAGGIPATPGGGERPSNIGRPQKPPSTHKDEESQLKCCFCFLIPSVDPPPSRPSSSLPYRPQPRPLQHTGPVKPSSAPLPSRARIVANSLAKTSTHSATSTYLSLIPASTDPQTASRLMNELARPFVDSEGPGYIYMFWVTPEDTLDSGEKAPPVEAVRSLFAPPPSSPLLLPPSPLRMESSRPRRPSDVVSRYAEATAPRALSGQGKKKLLLKIGRASNVQGRLNQWTRQCGHAIQLLRYYPYVPSSSASTSSLTLDAAAAPRKTPHCHRVERLIHIELAGKGMKPLDQGSCEACGHEHREWFEVDATREGVREVDEVLRRWVAWDEGICPL